MKKFKECLEWAKTFFFKKKTWDWEKIPGITVEHNGIILDCEHVSTLGKTVYVGGVSNGKYGIAAFNFSGVFTEKLNLLYDFTFIFFFIFQ